MFMRLMVAALGAGLGAGLVATLAQMASVLPLIHFAEYLEAGGLAADYSAPSGLFAVALAEPARLLGTMAFGVLGGVGFALLLGPVMVLSQRPLTWRTGLLWGLGGWAVVALAPAISQPPLPPGATFQDLESRQIWWLVTIAASATGLGLAVFSRQRALKVVAAVLLAAPHVLGAPGSGEVAALPPALLRDYALASLATTFVFWLVLGALAGHLLRPQGKAHNQDPGE